MGIYCPPERKKIAPQEWDQLLEFRIPFKTFYVS